MATRKKPGLVTALVSYNRPELLKQTVASYLETVTLPHHLVIVDNASDEETRDWLEGCGQDVRYLPENRYPGYAANFGWAAGLGIVDAQFLHRSDNDVRYEPGWCEEVLERFAAKPELGQLGLRTLEEEGPHGAVGGNCVIHRKVWEAGMRYGEDPWPTVGFEDAHLSNAVARAGFTWERVLRPCIEHCGVADRADPYYEATFRARGIW